MSINGVYDSQATAFILVSQYMFRAVISGAQSCEQTNNRILQSSVLKMSNWRIPVPFRSKVLVLSLENFLSILVFLGVTHTAHTGTQGFSVSAFPDLIWDLGNIFLWPGIIFCFGGLFDDSSPNLTFNCCNHFIIVQIIFIWPVKSEWHLSWVSGSVRRSRTLLDRADKPLGFATWHT